MSVDVKQFMRDKFESVSEDFVNDVKALTHDQLNTSPGGSARCAYDFTYEVAYINRRMAARISGTPPAAPPEGWMKADEAYKVKESAIKDFESSVQELLAVWDALPENELEREIVIPSGETVTPLEFMWIGINHAGYHDGQLNYLQAIFGDEAVHWG